MDVTIRALAPTDEDITLGRGLVREYAMATAEEMAAPGTEPDLARLLPHFPDWEDFSGRYFNGGGFLIVTVDGTLAGCVGIAAVDGSMCEMNRLWVRPAYRSLGLGRALVTASLDTARGLGFTRMILDALATRTRAIALYRSLGFTDADPIHAYDFATVSLGRAL